MSVFLKIKSCFEWRRNLNFSGFETSFWDLANQLLKKNIIKSDCLKESLKNNLHESIDVFSQLKNIENSLSTNDRIILFLIQKKKAEVKSNMLFYITEVPF